MFLPQKDISPDFKTNKNDSRIAKKLIRLEGTPRAIIEFDKHKSKLSDYGYWFLLSTSWVSYTGFSDLKMWKRLFSANRPLKDTSVMKPSELSALNDLPSELLVYRAKRIGEEDWIAYTLSPKIAGIMASSRGTGVVHKYKVHKADITALFLRRGEQEVIITDKNKVTPIGTISVAINETQECNNG
ncbi:hypothetical protein [Photobacterium kishitanii]|uniref:Uncharacterized protein n=1 Tax=Photobacterium kishitanii TaxID=318456 RepID=A0A2T3KLW4_9GAMM|nr:hypothetical protein [Photobacterium kishitanii]PSV00688.1 hypothetical protein C9J27_05985 [Photobacterium kishitanii]